MLSITDQLSSDGSSDANKGIRLAYSAIEESMIKNGNNRIILATDGAFKVSPRIKNMIKKGAREKDPIRLSIFYFSKKEYTHHKELLEDLSQMGSGKYRYIKKENAKKNCRYFQIVPLNSIEIVAPCGFFQILRQKWKCPRKLIFI